MLQKYKYEYQYKAKPLSELEIYCRIENLDSLVILSTAKKEKNQEKTKNVGKS